MARLGTITIDIVGGDEPFGCKVVPVAENGQTLQLGHVVRALNAVSGRYATIADWSARVPTVAEREAMAREEADKPQAEA